MSFYFQFLTTTESLIVTLCAICPKRTVHLKMKIQSHYLLALMLIEGQVYFASPQNTAEVSQENSAAESPKQWK